MYKIEKRIPVQPAASGPGNQRYPFRRMKVGDSFLVPTGDPAEKRIRSAACWFSKQHGGKFVVRKVDGGLRCWREE